MLGFSGRTVLVTGAAGAIGREIAQLFAHQGARVIAADLIPETAEETAERARGAGGECVSQPVDVTKREQLRDLMAQVDSDFGRLDVLVNSAGRQGGAGRGYRIEELPEGLWDQVLFHDGRVESLGKTAGVNGDSTTSPSASTTFRFPATQSSFASRRNSANIRAAKSPCRKSSASARSSSTP